MVIKRVIQRRELVLRVAFQENLVIPEKKLMIGFYIPIGGTARAVVLGLAPRG